MKKPFLLLAILCLHEQQLKQTMPKSTKKRRVFFINFIFFVLLFVQKETGEHSNEQEREFCVR